MKFYGYRNKLTFLDNILINLPTQVSSTKHPRGSLPPCTLSSLSEHALGHISGQTIPFTSSFFSTQSDCPLHPSLCMVPMQKNCESVHFGGHLAGQRFPCLSFFRAIHKSAFLQPRESTPSAHCTSFQRHSFGHTEWVGQYSPSESLGLAIHNDWGLHPRGFS